MMEYNWLNCEQVSERESALEVCEEWGRGMDPSGEKEEEEEY